MRHFLTIYLFQCHTSVKTVGNPDSKSRNTLICSVILRVSKTDKVSPRQIEELPRTQKIDWALETRLAQQCRFPACREKGKGCSYKPLQQIEHVVFL